MKNQLVELDEHGKFWFLEDEDGEGPLAPLSVVIS